jgi:hypothetical protein
MLIFRFIYQFLNFIFKLSRCIKDKSKKPIRYLTTQTSEGIFLAKIPFIQRFAETLRKLDSVSDKFDHYEFEFFNKTLNREFLGFLGVFSFYKNVKKKKS